MPTVEVDGPEAAGAAAPRVLGDTLTCPVQGAGTLSARVDGAKITLRFVATAPCSVERLALEGALWLPGARGWISNGLQSWSQSGALALGPPPSAKGLARALGARGDDEVYRTGEALSWWYTLVGGGPTALAAGATTARRLRSYVQVHRDPDRTDGALALRLVSGGGERIHLEPGEVLEGETWMVELGDDPHALLERYSAALPSRRAKKPVEPRAGWNSWYALWEGVCEADILEKGGNADAAMRALDPHLAGGEQDTTIVIDDGWECAWGDWEANPKFPSGMGGVAAELRARGQHAGIWIAPLLASRKSAVFCEHPDWFLPDATYVHPAHGKLRILDVTHPEAAAHLQATIRKLVEWGYDYLKLDFLVAGAYEATRAAPATGIEAYRRALELIREAAGDDVTLSACGALCLPTLEFADAWRVGNDIAFKPLPVIRWPHPGGVFIANQARSFAARYPFCSATLCDTDPAIVRAPQSEAEVEAGAWVAAAPGGGFFLSDDLRKTPDERVARALDRGKVRAGLSGAPAAPESFFPEILPRKLNSMFTRLFTGRHEVPEVWRMPDGRRVGFNFTHRDKLVEGLPIPARGARELPRRPLALHAPALRAEPSRRDRGGGAPRRGREAAVLRSARPLVGQRASFLPHRKVPHQIARAASI